MQARYLFATLVSANLLAAATVRAQETAAQLPAISVIGDTADDGRIAPKGSDSAPAQIRHTATQPVTVVDHQEIEMVNPLSTLDLFDQVPGATVNRTGGIGGTVFLRGLNTNDMRVPVFIDGDRFRGRNTLQFMLISPTEIEQMEVVRGPASSLYGSDGLGGLINFVTKRAHGDLDHDFQVTGGEASVTYRNNGNGVQSDVAMEASGSGFDLRAYVTGRRSGNYDTPAGTVPNSDYRSGGGGVVLGYMPDAKQRFEVSARVTTVDAGIAGSVPPYPTSIGRYAPLQVAEGRLAYAGEFDHSVVSKLDASLYIDDFNTHISTVNQANPARITDTISHVIGPVAIGGHVAATVPWGPTENVFGMDFMNEIRPGAQSRSEVTTPSGTTRTGYAPSGPNTYQTNIGAFANTTWKATRDLTVTAGGRFDWFHSDVDLSALPSPNLLPAFQAAQNAYDTATTGSLGLSYRATDVLELLGSVGTSFRMPWTSELFTSGYTGTSYTVPNPSLKPERGTTLEAGPRLHFDNATVGLTAFNSDYRNFIQTVNTTYMGLPATERENVGKARIQGVEADWRWQVTPRINVYGNASYLRGTDRTANAPLPSIAPLSGLAGVQYVSPGQSYSLSGELQWAGHQSRHASSEYPSAGYAVVNLYAQLQLDRLGLPQLGNTQLIFGVTNLFNADYRTAATTSNVAYPMTYLNPLIEPGRTVSLTLRTRF